MTKRILTLLQIQMKSNGSIRARVKQPSSSIGKYLDERNHRVDIKSAFVVLNWHTFGVY